MFLGNHCKFQWFWRDHCKFSMVFEETITIECFLGGLTIAINGFTMVFWCCYHRFQWFSMVPDHWSNDAMVSMDRCGLNSTLGSVMPLTMFHLLCWQQSSNSALQQRHKTRQYPESSSRHPKMNWAKALETNMAKNCATFKVSEVHKGRVQKIKMEI